MNPTNVEGLVQDILKNFSESSNEQLAMAIDAITDDLLTIERISELDLSGEVKVIFASISTKFNTVRLAFESISKSHLAVMKAFEAIVRVVKVNQMLINMVDERHSEAVSKFYSIYLSEFESMKAKIDVIESSLRASGELIEINKRL